MPCIVNNRLYVSGPKSQPCGVSNCSRISSANNPPSAKKKVIEMSHSSAMRLWSVVRSHERMP